MSMTRIGDEHARTGGVRCTRRGFLQIGAGIADVMAVPAVFASRVLQQERTIGFLNLHTGEKLQTTYWSDGDYVSSGLGEINDLLRDHRSGEVFDMDPQLLDLLFLLQAQVASPGKFHIISGYRSPATNEKLRKTSSGIARRSYHMQGKAVDIRLPGCDLKHLHKSALALKAGGVGYYQKSNFIHVDTGPVRSW